jgi:hypothetical protein
LVALGVVGVLGAGCGATGQSLAPAPAKTVQGNEATCAVVATFVRDISASQVTQPPPSWALGLERSLVHGLAKNGPITKNSALGKQAQALKSAFDTRNSSAFVKPLGDIEQTCIDLGFPVTKTE